MREWQGNQPDFETLSGREDLIIEFDKPFRLPETINLDPDNSDYIESITEEQPLGATLVDRFNFTVVSSNIHGNFDIWHLTPESEIYADSKFIRPFGPIGPYAIGINLQTPLINDGEYSRQYFKATDGAQRYNIDMDPTGLEGAYMELFSGEWTTDEGETGNVVYAREDLKNLQFSLSGEYYPLDYFGAFEDIPTSS